MINKPTLESELYLKLLLNTNVEVIKVLQVLSCVCGMFITLPGIVTRDALRSLITTGVTFQAREFFGF